MEIFNFHLSEQQKNGVLASDVSVANLRQLTDATENFTGLTYLKLSSWPTLRPLVKFLE
jgi:hypothetical protein